MVSTDRLVWVDLEMTGLDPYRCKVVEVATIITDGNLEVVAEGPNIVVFQPEEALAEMDDVVVRMHTRSGLLTQIRESKVSLEEAEAQTLAFVQQHCEARTSPLCGNSIWKDRQFVERYMPKFDAHLHYRNIDVSSIKELARRWYGGKVNAPPKKESHRALDDILESIAELKYYRKHLFVPAL